MKIHLVVLAMAAALGLIAAACGDASAPQLQAQDNEVSAPDVVPTSTPSEDTFDKVVAPHTTTISTTDASQPTVVLEPVTTTEPSEESFADPFGPIAGEEIGVIGVAFDDVLYVRVGPGADEQIVATLDPLAVVDGTGRHQQLSDGAVWWEVTVGEAVGWAHSSYLSRLGDPVSLSGIDITLTDASLADLGRAVVEGYLSGIDPDSTVTMTLAPRGEHDLAEVVYDITGSGDDSLSGMRLHVLARPTDDRQAFQLLGVEATAMCWRGVHQGVCV